MHYFQPDPFTRTGVAIPDMTLQPSFQTAGDICNRRLIQDLPQAAGTNAILERGLAGAVEWMECPDNLWATVSPHLQGIEVTSATVVAPAGYARQEARSRMSRFNGKRNLLIISDSLARHGGLGVDGTDSYGTAGFQQWAGATVTPWGGSAPDEYVTPSKALLHNGNGGSFFAGGDIVDYANDHEMMRPVKYSTLGLVAGDIIYIALGTNDFSNTLIAGQVPTGAQVWARAQTFIAGLRASFPTAKIVVATVPRSGDNPFDNQRPYDYNALLRADIALGIDAVCDIEKAHPAFDTQTGNSLDPAYLDGRHFAAAGKAAAATALAATLATL